MRRALTIIPAITLALAVISSQLSCDLLTDEDLAAVDYFFDILEGPVKEPLTGQNAFMYLQQDKSRLPTQDHAALMGALKTADGDEKVADPGYDTVDLLQGTIRAKQGIRADKFKIDPEGAFPAPPEDELLPERLSLDTSQLQDEYLIPHLEAIPVRNQGERGTCAAFAAIGHIEHAVLRQMPMLGTVDLSEQRFYYSSKPECQSEGCDLSEEGSWYGDGMQASVNATTYDIPRENECPYNDKIGSNDVQVPQQPSCQSGAVRLVQLKYVQDPIEILSVLENDGLPVPYASKLSDNWRYNDGLITNSASSPGEVDKHSGGHAYLIVGYRKLPTQPEEGGMCFIVKNSWGAGWGVNGYSCMTLEWMDTWGMNYLEHPIVMDVLVNEDLIAEPEDAPEPLPDYFVPEVYDDETVDWDDFDDGDEDEIPLPEPDPEPVTQWTTTALLGPDGHYYKAELWNDTSDSTVKLRSYIRNTSTPTGNLELTAEPDGALLFEGDHVGDLESDHVVLCTGPYDVLCSLRMDKANNRLYLEFVNPEFRLVKPEDLQEGTWESIFGAEDGNDFGLEFFNGDNLGEQLLHRFVLIRLSDGKGTKTDAMRLSLDGFQIKLMGESIGSIKPGSMSLCSGSHKGNCRLYKGRNGLTIMPKVRPN